MHCPWKRWPRSNSARMREGLLESLRVGVICPIHTYRGHGDKALTYRLHIRAGLAVRVHYHHSSLPVVGAAPRVFAIFDPVLVDALSHPANSDTAQLLIVDGGNVDVE